jgi:hypothetical protein
MLVPLFYLSNFELFRRRFLRRYQTEPYVTAGASTIGARPSDFYTSEGRDGRKRKYGPEREIGSADFVFSFAAHLIPALTIGFARYLIKDCQ